MSLRMFAFGLSEETFSFKSYNMRNNNMKTTSVNDTNIIFVFSKQQYLRRFSEICIEV